MTKLEVITREDLSRFDAVAPDLADIYVDAFRRGPWYENSRCPNDACPVGFSASDPGGDCVSCDTTLVEAYDKKDLADGWRTKLARGAILEVTRDDRDKIRRMTLALSMTIAELGAVKYPDNPVMRRWLEATVPQWMGENPVIGWIDDTAGNRIDDPDTRGLYPSSERLRTLQTVSDRYGYYDRCGAQIGAVVLTRTKQPAVVATTKRAVPGTQIFVGTDGCTAGFEVNGAVEDPRTLLAVPGRAILERV